VFVNTVILHFTAHAPRNIRKQNCITLASYA